MGYLEEYYNAMAELGPPKKKKETDITPSGYAYPQTDKNNIMASWLRANPAAVFQSTISKLGRPMSSFFGSRFGDYYNRYLGDIANTGNQKMEFGDWLGKQNFLQDYYSKSPYQRGSFQNLYAPPARTLSY